MKLKLSNLKKVFLLFSFIFALTANAQAPEKMSYQAVIRNTANALVTNQAVGMRISILQVSASGMGAYVETQTPTTNANGLVSLEIGSGTVVAGTFANINWANGPYFIKTETDPTGGTSYTITGTSQLLSSPYALYAKNGTPTGGTANQVLAKVDGTNYNTAWVTPSGGSTSLPTQTGNAGNVLTTDGTNASWANMPGAKLELQASKIAATQALANANGTNTGDVVVFENVVTTPTIGTYSTSTNSYTAGAAGLYYIQAVVRTVDNTTAGNTTNQWLYVDVNNTNLSGLNNILPNYVAPSPNNFPAGSKGRGAVSGVIYLNSGDIVNIKGLNANNAISNSIKNDGSGKLMIVKLN